MLKSSYISNFKNVIDTFTYISIESIIIFFLSLGILCIIIYLSRKLKGKVRSIVLFLMLFLLIRLLLLANPFAWGLYSLVLTLQDVGWRQYYVINHEFQSYLKKPPINYLAIGSSQAHDLFIYYSYWTFNNSEINNKFGVFWQAAFSPMDFLLYKKRIFDYSPKHILLYLSEFDLASPPGLDYKSHGPRQGFFLIDLVSLTNELKGSSEKKEFLTSMLIGEFFPEYKYSFVFKAITSKLEDKLTNTKTSYPGFDATPKEMLEGQLKYFSTLDGKWVNYNFALLKKFLDICDKKGLPVIIVEGQYNPVAYNEKNRWLNFIIKQKLAALAANYSRVTFVPTPPFEAGCYKDLMHVKRECAIPFSVELMHHLPQ